MAEKIRKSVDEFFFTPASPLPLAALRIGLAMVLLVQAWSLAPDLYEMYGRNGLLQGALGDFFSRPELPSLTWIVSRLQTLGLSEIDCLRGLGGAYVASLICLLLGFRTRVVAPVVWALHLILTGTQITSYGVDQIAHIFLFYLIIAPAGAALSLDVLSGREDAGPSALAGLMLRVMQIHLAAIYLCSGVEKTLGVQWWNGEAIWRSLMIPLYASHDFSWLAQVPWLAKLLCWQTLVVECGYAVFIWMRRTRVPWLVATVGLHLGIAAFMGLEIFAVAMIVYNIALFAVPLLPHLARAPQRGLTTRALALAQA